MTEKRPLEIHSENILPIIKRWLYSERDIFVRELVSNSCDAIHKMKILRDAGEAAAIQTEEEDPFRIEVHIDKEKRTIQFVDNGIGMTAEEVRRYIAQIAFSGAEDFVQKYRGKEDEEQIIGHFGLGFYSSYMVAERVEIDTLSYLGDAEPALWRCDGSAEYEMDRGTRAKRGTTVTLFVDEENDEFLDPVRLGKVLSHYCGFLPYPIYLSSRQINSALPLWIKAPSECQEEEYKEFYEELYSGEEEPLFWIHLNVDYPFQLKGILYFPKVHRDSELKKGNVKLFCNRVFVSDDCKEILPRYLLMLRGALDSPNIPLNVSRSYLQMDRVVRQLAAHISKKVADSLLQLAKNQRERFLKIWEDISTVIKLGAVEDEKFYDRVQEALLWKESDSGEWMTADQYLDRYAEQTEGKVFYTADARHASQILALYQKRGIGVLCAGHPIDSYLLPLLEKKSERNLHFQRIDGAIDKLLLDKEREQTLLDAEGKTAAGRLSEMIRRHLSGRVDEVQAESLNSDELPAFLSIDEKERRFRETMRLWSGDDSSPFPASKRTLIVNTNNRLMNALPALEVLDSSLAKEIVEETYDLALLSQREIDHQTLNQFIARTSQIIEKLVEKATTQA